MSWLKRTDANSIEELVIKRTGMTKENLLDDTRVYKYPKIDDAAKLLQKHMHNNSCIRVYGDYDVDGVTSLFELRTLFDAVKYSNVQFIAPHRFTDGYGINVARVKQFHEDGCNLLITIDNGIAAIDALKLASDLGMDVLVLDHHDPFINEFGEIVLPPATVIVDPHITGGADLGDHVFEDLCGAGIGWHFVSAVLDLFDIDSETKDTVLNECLIAAGIGTVADVVTLVDENRKIVKEAIEFICNGKYVTAGLKKLLETLSVEKPTSTDIAFGVAPALNASGRIYDDGADRMVEILSSRENSPELDALCKRAKEANDERKDMTTKAVQRAEEMMLERSDDSMIVLLDEELSPGVAGLVAAKLTETYYRPSIVLTKNALNICKGSGRSIEGINLKALLDLCQEYLLGYGGHPMAAGVALEADKVDTFRDAICKVTPILPMPTDTYYDVEVAPDKDALMKTYNETQIYEPYGQGNETITVMIPGIKLGDSMGNTHRIIGREKTHVKFITKYGFDIVWFDGAGEYEFMGKPKTIDVIGTLSLNVFNGKATLQVLVNKCRRTA